jgi:DNA-binding transcriptional ArsR family regulator
MSQHHVVEDAVVKDAIDRLRAAVKPVAGDQVDSAVEIIADLVADALIFGRPEVVNALLAPVEQVASQLRARGSRSAEVAEAAGQLRALSAVLGVAAHWRPRVAVADLVREPKYRPLLEALLLDEGPITNRELARRTGLAEETVARHLPELRAAGIVTSRRVWKHIENRLRREIVGEVRAALRGSGSPEARQEQDASSLRSMVEELFSNAREVVGNDPVGFSVTLGTLVGLGLSLLRDRLRQDDEAQQPSALTVENQADGTIHAEVRDDLHRTSMTLSPSAARVQVDEKTYNIPLPARQGHC